MRGVKRVPVRENDGDYWVVGHLFVFVGGVDCHEVTCCACVGYDSRWRGGGMIVSGIKILF